MPAADQAPPPQPSIATPEEEIRGRMEMLEKQVKDLELASGGKQPGARVLVSLPHAKHSLSSSIRSGR